MCPSNVASPSNSGAHTPRFDELLGTDFDGEPTGDPDDVICEGLDDARHRERVPALVELMNDPAAPARERLLSCLALTTWAEPAGYEAVITAAEAPRATPWYGVLTGRALPVDSTFAHLVVAVADSDDMAGQKGTAALRTEAFRALVRIADGEYLGYLGSGPGEPLDPVVAGAVAQDMADAVARGAASLAAARARARTPLGFGFDFDVLAQLTALADAVAAVDARLGADLAGRLAEAGRAADRDVRAGRPMPALRGDGLAG
ncbi:hypothetical protein AB0I49_27595 [Streptomyces sp. NPDC050617]|uniref:hypothetical protein n=1 Tax=Streptomyces sp. NPDC050617 TaxID=3154628 RepID=UPI003423C1AA